MNQKNHAVKVLWVSDSPLVGSGFGRVTREITTRLAKVPGLEIACLGWSYDGWPYDRAQFPFNIYPSRGPSHGPENFERVINEFAPDVVITLAEIWMIDWLHTHPTRPRFKWIGYFPMDGGPFYPPWGNARATPQVKSPKNNPKRQRRGPVSEIIERRILVPHRLLPPRHGTELHQRYVWD